MEEKISIIIPVFKVEKYLKRCIDSVIKQTYKNIEIILIEDGSPDNCGNICDEYKKIDNRIKVIHQENKGVSNARNKGLDMAKGNYITFVDADDYIDNHYIEKLYEDCINNDVDISITGTNDIDISNKIIRKSKEKKEVMTNIDTIKELMNEQYIQSVVWGKLYKKELFENIRFNVNSKIAEDLEILYKILKITKKVSINTKNALYFFTIREDSATTNEYNKNWENEIKINKDIIEDVKSNNFELVPYAIKRYVRINYTCMLKILKYTENDNKNYNELVNNVKTYLKNYITYSDVEFNKKIKLILAVYCKKLMKIIIKIK